MKLRLSVEGDAPLATRDGTVIGRLESVTVSIDVAAFRAICDAPRGTIGSKAVIEAVPTSTPTTPTPSDADGQESFLPNLIEETWDVYVKALDRPKAVLTPKVRKWIADAHKAVGVDETRKAIRGLAASDYHREHGYVGIEYAIRPKTNETIEGRVAQMTARVGEAQPATNGLLTVDQLVDSFKEEHRQRVRHEIIAPINAALRNSEDRDMWYMAEAQIQRLKDMGYEVVIEDGSVVGARVL